MNKKSLPQEKSYTVPPPDALRPQCPKCGHRNSAVTDSRPHEIDGILTIRRRRACTACGERWHTVEVSESNLSEFRRQIGIRFVRRIGDVVADILE